MSVYLYIYIMYMSLIMETKLKPGRNKRTVSFFTHLGKKLGPTGSDSLRTMCELVYRTMKFFSGQAWEDPVRSYCIIH